MTVLVTIFFFLLLGLAYILYAVKVAQIDEEDLGGQEYDLKKFAKPAGWKVGTLPKELENNKISVKNCSSPQPSSVMSDLIESWKAKKLTQIEDTDFPE